MLKIILKLLLSCLIAVVIEMGYFNFDVIQSQMRDDQSLVLGEQDLQYKNWDDMQNMHISLSDPMIYADKLDILAYKINFEFDAEPEVEQCTFFYTNMTNEAFSAEKMMIVPVNDGKVNILLENGQMLSAIRIDLGEDAGTILHHIEVRINDISWHISVSRIIAMLAVYWGTLGLMRLQHSPDYGVGNGKKETGLDEAWLHK